MENINKCFFYCTLSTREFEKNSVLYSKRYFYIANDTHFILDTFTLFL